jgi:hypothetical protein
VAADPKGFAAKVHALMDPARARAMGEVARERVLRDYAWRASFELLDPLLEPAVDIAAEAVAV